MLREQLLGGVGAVERLARAVVAGAGMVAADDQVGAAVVLADDRVPDRLARAGHAHGERQQAQRRGLLGIVLQQLLVAAHAGEVVDVAGLGHADDRLDQEVGLGGLGGAEGQLLVRAVHGIAGLERDHPAPAQLAEAVAQLLRRVAQMLEVVVHRRLDALQRCRRDRRCRHGRAGSARAGCALSSAPNTAIASARLSGCQRSVTVSVALSTPSRSRRSMVSPSSSCLGEGRGHVERDRDRPQGPLARRMSDSTLS